MLVQFLQMRHVSSLNMNMTEMRWLQIAVSSLCRMDNELIPRHIGSGSTLITDVTCQPECIQNNCVSDWSPTNPCFSKCLLAAWQSLSYRIIHFRQRLNRTGRGVMAGLFINGWFDECQSFLCEIKTTVMDWLSLCVDQYSKTDRFLTEDNQSQSLHQI